MPLRNLLAGFAVLVLAAGGYLYHKGGVAVGKKGVVVDASKMEAPGISPYAKGEALFQVFKYEGALAAFRQGLKRDPKNSSAPMARYRVAECLKRLGKEREALGQYRRFLGRYPNHRMAGQAQKWVTVLDSTS